MTRFRPLRRALTPLPCPNHPALLNLREADWSESRNLWSASKPMDCEETMLAQARALHDLNPAGMTWICALRSAAPRCARRTGP